MDVVVGHAARVGRAGPGERDLSGGRCPTQVRGCCRRGRVTGRRETDERADRRNAVAVEEEEEVVTRRGQVGRGRLHGDAAGADGEIQELEALVLVERMGHRRSSDQRDLRDLGGIGCRHVEARAVAGTDRRRGDRRPRSLEQVGRRVELRVQDVRRPTWQRSAAGHENPPVREKQCRRVVFPAVGE